MRYIVLSLLVINLLYLGWTQARPRQAAAPASPPPQFPLNTGLVLLSEYQGDLGAEDSASETAGEVERRAGADAVAAATDPASQTQTEAEDSIAAVDSGRQPDACLLFGPFPSTEEAEGFRAEVEDAGVVASISQPETRLPSYYRVFIPPAPSPEAAAAVLNDINASISAAGMNIDTYLERQGSRRNAVSLGVFSQEANAFNVQAALETLGYETEKEEIPRFTGEIRVVVPPLEASLLPLAQWHRLMAPRPYLTLTDTPC